MILELSLLIISCAVMITVLVHKHRESARGALLTVHNVRSKTDPVLHNVRHVVLRFISYLTVKNAVLLGNYLFVHAVRFLMKFSHKIHRLSAEFVSRASKKKEDLTRGGTASFYIKKIKEDAKKEGSGEIV